MSQRKACCSLSIPGTVSVSWVLGLTSPADSALGRPVHAVRQRHNRPMPLSQRKMPTCEAPEARNNKAKICRLENASPSDYTRATLGSARKIAMRQSSAENSISQICSPQSVCNYGKLREDREGLSATGPWRRIATLYGGAIANGEYAFSRLSANGSVRTAR